MITSIIRLSSLLISVALLLTGHGLQLALIPLRAELIGWTTVEVGYLSSLYFVGFVSGCFTIPPVVARIGHIRTFATLTAIATVAVLGFALSGNFLFWLLLRFVSGAAIVGLYLVIESWLNSQVNNDVRGSVLATYTAIVLAGLAIGQLLLNAAPLEGERLFIIAAMLIVLAALPVCLTSSAQPGSIPSARFSPRLVFRTSRAACLGALVSGLITGSFYGLGPIYGLQSGLDITEVSIMMAMGIAGGALLQLPLGRLSDRMDRRRVIFGAMIFGAAVATVALFVDQIFIPVVMFFFGASVMPIYALSLAQASDHSESDKFLEVGTGLLMINALGSIVGPLITAGLMERFGTELFFTSHIVVLVSGSILVLSMIRIHRSLARHFTLFSLATTAVGQGVLEIDPRTEEWDQDEPEEEELSANALAETGAIQGED